MNKNATCDDNNIKVEGQRCTGAKCLYTIENKLVLLKLGCYEGKTLIVIPKITTKRIIFF